MPLILGTNSIKASGYDVANSAKFNTGNSHNLSRTPSSSSNRRTFTFSTWFKLSGTDGTFISAGTDISNGPLFIIDILSGGNEGILRVEDSISGDNVIGLRTTRKLRDTTGWIHLCVAIDTTQSTASDRVKVYINGTQETSFGTETYCTQNLELSMNQNHITRIGTRATSPSGKYFNGYMCETVLIDGLALGADSFGEFDTDTPNVFKPKDVSGLTFGTNGFYLDYKDSSALGNDVSGNNNDWTANNFGAADQSIDTATNNFTTLNNLVYSSASKTFSEGNTTISTSDSGNWCATQNNIGVRNGKWYMEVKITGLSSFFAVGVGFNPLDSNGSNVSAFENSTYLVGEDSGTYGWRNNGALPQGGSSLNTYTTNDILMIALDMDNLKVYFGKNGSWENSGNPTSGSTGTGSMGNLTAGEDYFFIFTPRNASCSVNFGYPIYSISSGNTDGTYGNFEYSVPSGYYSLCTKNLAEYG